MKPHQNSRREMIKVFVLSGFSLCLSSCRFFEHSEPEIDQKKPDEDAVDTLVHKAETVLEANEVIYVQKTSETYEQLRQGFNRNVQKFPLVIALCTTTAGVAAAMRYAQAEGMNVAVKSGGHSFEGFSSIDHGLQINLSLMNTVKWEKEHQLRIGPGCMLKEIYDTVLPKGRIIPAGSCGTVGMGGLALGGGYGFFARQYGLTCDSIVEATFVDGQGKIHTVKEGDELMWALKGGGNGNFGIVTSFLFKTYPAPDGFARYRFKAFKLDASRAKTLLEAYFTYSSKLPETCFAAFVLNYKTMVLLITNYGAEDHPALTEMIEVFTGLADKTSIGTKKDVATALRTYYGIQHPIYFKNASAGYYKSYASIQNSIDEVLNVMFKKRGLIYQINTLGGAIDTPELASRSCYPHRQLPYLSELQAYWDEGQNPEELVSSFDEIQEILYRHGIRRQYRNYPSLGFKNWETAYYGTQYQKLQQIKKKYDPEMMFSHPQTVTVNEN